jgi:uncharacterized delta-60 repeat protein
MWLFAFRKPRPKTSIRPLRRTYRPCLDMLEDRCLLSSGALDLTFGSGGIVTTSLNSYDDFAHGVLLQSNGDLIAYGGATTVTKKTDYTGFGLARYTPSGSLDTTFGAGGIVTTFAVGKTSIEFPLDDTQLGVSQAALQADGKIVAVGNGSYLVRYDGNGSLDTTFGSGGLVTVPSGFSVDSVLIQPSNGDIVVGGNSVQGSNNYFALLRYTPTGTLDATFGSGGEVVTTAVAGSSVNYLALENGDIVAGGFANGVNSDSWALARYTLGGSLDTTFGSGGIVMTSWAYLSFADPAVPAISSLLVEPNGQIVAVGTGRVTVPDVWALARYNIDGSLDSTFGSGGIVTSSPTGRDVADGSALESNGQIVVTGWSSANNVFEVGVYNANGSLDTSFGSGGFVTTSWFGGIPNQDNGGGVVIQPGGKIVTAASERFAKRDFMLARYGPSAPQIGAFTASPNPVMAGSSVTLTASNITLADPNSTITQVAFYVDSNGDGALDAGDTLLGYATQTSPGVWTFTFTVNLTPGTYTLFTQAEDSDGVFSDPLTLSLQVQ